MLPADGFVTTDDGVRLFVRTLGRGRQTVVFPNGLYLFDDFKYLAEDRTVIFYDLRNRGLSDHVSDPEKLKEGIHHDVEDLEVVRRHFGVSRVNLLGHSYVGVTVMLYAMKYPAHVNRVVQIGSMPPDQSAQYPPHLTAHRSDARRDAGEARRTAFLPSIRRLTLTADDMAKVAAPVLTIHGRKDRSTLYGGGREWAARLPNARLVTVDDAAHAPWIEDPETVFRSIETFLDGTWPEAAQRVESRTD